MNTILYYYHYTLLELTLNNMKNETIRHAKLTKIKTDYTENTLKDELQELISQDISEENMEAIQAKQDELGTFEEQKLFDILTKKRNYQLLEDEKPTRDSYPSSQERPATAKLPDFES